MKIIQTQIMSGASLWSAIYSKLVVLTVTDAPDDNFTDHEQTLLVTLLKYFPQLNITGEKPQLVAGIIKELLHQADMPCDFTATEKINDKIFKIIYTYTNKEIGIYTGQAAVNIVNGLQKKIEVDLNFVIDELRSIAKKYALGATSAYILGEAEKRGIPLRRFQNTSLFTLGHGIKQRLIRTAVTDSTSGLGIEVAGDKEETKQLLASANVPVPKGLLINNEEELKKSISKIKFPIVTKPLDGNQGRGVTTHIHNLEQALFGFQIAQKISDTVILEEFIAGDDYRFLVIDYKLVAVARRTPAMVTGDGQSTLQQLIDAENLNPDRGHSSEHVLAPIKVDKITEKILGEKKLTLQSVLPDREILYLKETANISAGGTATDVTDEVHPFTVFMVERIARLFKLNVCGIDIMMTDISKPLSRDTGAIIEVNAGPGIRMHTNPQKGIARNVAAPIINMLFPSHNAWKIPTVAVCGDIKLTQLVAHLARHGGYKQGYTSLNGIFIQDHLLAEGDFTRSHGAQDLLFDPTIGFAVLQCSEQGIIEEGLGFESCDISILSCTDAGKARPEAVKALSIIAGRTALEGCVILSADDDLIFSLYKEPVSHVALISADPENPRITAHIGNGGLAAVMEGDYLVIYDGKKILVEQAQCIPYMQADKEKAVHSVLAAALAAYLGKFELAQIQEGLRTFA